MRRPSRAWPLVAGALVACGEGGDAGERTRTIEELMDPETCKECHLQHYEEWSGSMHAYASIDPVFRAMNAKGQEETKDREHPLGSFCVNCHAPLAVQVGATEDGLNLDTVPKHLQGVTCYFCHQVEDVTGTHNNPLVLANDTTMRGAIADAVPSGAHGSAYSRLHDGNSLESSKLCGACHDIVVPKELTGGPADVHLERTFGEWQESIFSKADSRTPNSCGASGCHMRRTARTAIAAPPDAKRAMPTNRNRHDHSFPAVDLALTPFPEDDDRRDEQRRAIEDFLDSTLNTELCVTAQTGLVHGSIENRTAGHAFPSGATQDRRFWVELRAFDQEGRQTFSKGVVPDGTAPTAVDPLLLIHDETFDKDGRPTHDFWDVAEVRRRAIPAPITNDPDVPGWHREIVPLTADDVLEVPPLPARVDVLLRLQPVGLDVLEELVAEGYLEEWVMDAMPTFDILPSRGQGATTTVTWTPGAPQTFLAPVCVDTAD